MHIITLGQPSLRGAMDRISIFYIFKATILILIDKPTGKRTFGKPRRRWEDNIRMDLKEIGLNTRNWIDSAQDRDYW